MVRRLIRWDSTFACRRASESCLARYLAWRSLFIRRLLAIGLSSSSIFKNKHSIPKRYRQTGQPAQLLLLRRKMLSCFDTAASAKEVSAIKTLIAFEKIKSCFEEFQLIFAISQSDFQKTKPSFLQLNSNFKWKAILVSTEPIRGLQTIGLKNDSIERKNEWFNSLNSMFVYINTSEFRLQRLRKIFIFDYGYSVENLSNFSSFIKIWNCCLS